MDGLPSLPTQLVPILAGPAGAVVVLVLWVLDLRREVGAARAERDKFREQRDEFREQRDEFRFLAGDAVREGKRAAQAAVVLNRSVKRHAAESEAD